MFQIVGGELVLDMTLESNRDIVEVAWINIDDKDKIDSFTFPMLSLYLE